MNFNRIITAISLIIWVVIALSLNEFQDFEFGPTTFPVWYLSFSLPLFSVVAIGLWHDIGRSLWQKWLIIDSKKLNQAMWFKWSVFSVWMICVLSLIAWVFVSVDMMHMIPTIVLFGMVFPELLVMDWTNPTGTNNFQFIFLMFWSLSCYFVYIVLKIVWIVAATQLV